MIQILGVFECLRLHYVPFGKQQQLFLGYLYVYLKMKAGNFFRMLPNLLDEEMEIIFNNRF